MRRLLPPAVGYSLAFLTTFVTVGCARNTYGPYQGYPAYPMPYPNTGGVPIQPTGVPNGVPGVVYGAPIGQPGVAGQPVPGQPVANPVLPNQPGYTGYPAAVPQPYPGYAPPYYAPPVDKSKPFIGS